MAQMPMQADETDQGEKLAVVIEIDAQGQISVGAEPPDQPEGQQEQPGDEEAAEQSYMQRAKSIDDALRIAGDLLRNAPQVRDAQGQEGFDSVFPQKAAQP